MLDDSVHTVDGTPDATTGGVPATRLAFLLILICIATSCAQSTNLDAINATAPVPEPALPSDCDPFVPPAWVTSPTTDAPALAEWTRTGSPDSVIALTGSRLSSYSGATAGQDTQFQVFGQTARGSFTGRATILCQDGMKAAIALPADLPADSEYLIWPENAAGTGSPAAVNATEAWWVGPNVATRGDTLSVYGRNLAHDTSGKASHVYLQQEGGAGSWVTVSAANPYKVDFTVPRDLADGTYQVWVHNGRGGHYGWSGPLALTINDGMPWSSHLYNVKDYGAKGNGVTDDEAAIESAVEAAAKDPWSTIYLPEGTYMVSQGFTPPSKVRWLGAGQNRTSIKANAAFVKPPHWNARSYCLLFTNSGFNNIAVQDLTLDGNGNLNGYLGEPIYLRFDSDVRFTNVTLNGKGYAMGDLHGSTRVRFQHCDLIGGGNGLFLGAATQVAFDSCHVYGTDDANTMLTYWGGDSLSFVNTTGQDYNNRTPDGWAQGRFIYGSSQWGSNRNIYIGNCTTKDLAVRPGYANQNTGEQLLWENGTHYAGKPVAATARSVVFNNSAFFTDPGLPRGEYEAVIVNGTGLGQHRKIAASSGPTVTVDPAWNVTPDRSSTVIIAGVVSHCAIYQNTLQGKSNWATADTASAGIQPYGNSYDFIADGNTISQMRTAIHVWGMAEDSLAPKSIVCAYFNYFANNVSHDCLTGVRGVSQAWEGWPSSDAYPGISLLGNVFKGNTIASMSVDGIEQLADKAPPADQVDLSVFDHNSIVETPVAISTQASGHVFNTLNYRNSVGGK